MGKTKILFWSMLAFIIVIIGSSIVYLLVDFKTNDITPSVRLFSTTQLVIVSFLLFSLLISKKRRNIAWSVHTTLGFLLCIQMLPALLWFLFNGKIVAETQMDNGVIGHWIYGLFHVVIIVWGIFNILGYRKRIKSNVLT